MSYVVSGSGSHAAGVVPAPGGATNTWSFILSYEESVPTTLMHHWDFEDGSGTTVTDIEGGANGNIVGTNFAWAVADPVYGGALDLSGGGSSSDWNNGVTNSSAGSYVDLPNHIMASFTGAATIEATYVQEQTGSNWQRVYSFGASNAGEGNSGAGIGQVFLTPWDGGNMKLDFSGGSVFYSAGQNAYAINHVVFVLDPSGYIAKCYRNGVLVGTVNGTVQPLSSLDDFNNWIGRSQWPDSMFNGKILDLRIYTGIMTAAEVAARYTEITTPVGPVTGPSISVSIPAGGPITIVWPDDGFSYSVLTNADLTNTNGWGVLAVTPYADGGNSVVTNGIGAESTLFYKLESN